LARLEENFAGGDRTSLLVLARGVPSTGAPKVFVVREDVGDTHRIELGEPERTALATGGSIELFHELVEPRPLLYVLSFEGETKGSEPREIAIEPEPDRLTFLEIDLSALETVGAAAVRTWVR
jgi:hypothetical protein